MNRITNKRHAQISTLGYKSFTIEHTYSECGTQAK